jgi:hypothetical protein
MCVRLYGAILTVTPVAPNGAASAALLGHISGPVDLQID